AQQKMVCGLLEGQMPSMAARASTPLLRASSRTRTRAGAPLAPTGGTDMKRAANWPKAGIHTVNERRDVARRLDRRNAEVERVVTDMAHGESLHLHFEGQRGRRRGRGPVWFLSGGLLIDPEIAKLVIAHPDVAPVGDSLFAGALSQTYRY